MTLHSFCHLLHSAVDGWIFDLEPVVSIPANQKPHILFPIQLLLIDLQLGCAKQVGLGNDLSQDWKMNRNTMFSLWHWQRLITLSWTADYRPHKTLSWLPFRKTGPQWCEHLVAVGAEWELRIRTKQWMQQFAKWISQWISIRWEVWECYTAVILVWTSSPISATFPSQRYAIFQVTMVPLVVVH